MEILMIVMSVIAGYLMLYTIIDRICRCCETCAIAKSYGRGGKLDEAIDKMVGKIN